MKFKESLIQGTYLLSFYLILSYLLAILEKISHNYVFGIKGGQLDWTILIHLPVLLLFIISKLVLVRDETNVNLLQYIHYFGIYKVINVLRNIVILIQIYIRYSPYPNEQFIEQMKFQIYGIGFNLILGIALFYLGYRHYKGKRNNIPIFNN